MAGRIRTIKPELFENRRTAGLSDAAFRLYVGLILQADDYGNFYAEPARLQAAIFWARPPERPIEEVLAEVSRVDPETPEKLPLVHFYRVSGERYGSLTGWKEHQKVDKPGRPRVPGPDRADPVKPAPQADSRDPRENVAKESRDPRETLGPDLRSVPPITDPELSLLTRDPPPPAVAPSPSAPAERPRKGDDDAAPPPIVVPSPPAPAERPQGGDEAAAPPTPQSPPPAPAERPQGKGGPTSHPPCSAPALPRPRSCDMEKLQQVWHRHTGAFTASGLLGVARLVEQAALAQSPPADPDEYAEKAVRCFTTWATEGCPPGRQPDLAPHKFEHHWVRIQRMVSGLAPVVPPPDRDRGGARASPMRGVAPVSDFSHLTAPRKAKL